MPNESIEIIALNIIMTERTDAAPDIGVELVKFLYQIFHDFCFRWINAIHYKLLFKQ